MVRGANEIADWLSLHIADELGLDSAKIERNRAVADYGLDSVHALRLTTALAEWLDRRVVPELAYDYPTIELLAEHLAANSITDSSETRGPAGSPHRPASGEVHEPIAIIGIGCRLPGADGPEQYWQLLAGGIDAISEPPPGRWDSRSAIERTRPDISPGVHWGGFLPQIDQFDAAFFGISPREATRMDPQQRLILEVSWEALEDAGQVTERLAGSRTGVFIGTSTNEYATLHYNQPAELDAYSGTGVSMSVTANRLSYLLDLRGPSVAVDTACSSSLVAVHLACHSLRGGECELALAGGVSVLLSPALNIVFQKAGVLASDGRCKTFDARADGFVRSEGAGVVVLKPLGRALADGDPIYAIIRGTATNHDGQTNGLMSPSRRSQEDLLAEAYRRSGVSPGAVQYVETHGTGTFLGDTIEARALGEIMSDGRPSNSRCFIGSHKTNIGHLEAAAGVAGLIKVALALQHRMIPPSLHFTDPNPNIPWGALPLDVCDRLTPWPQTSGRLIAGVSSFGFGGTNAHAVLCAAPQVRSTQPDHEPPTFDHQLLALSAKSSGGLHALAGRYRDALANGVSLADLCYTAAVRRAHHDHRLAVVARTPAQADQALADFQNGRSTATLSTGRYFSDRKSRIIFVFSGHGSQWFGMGQHLYADDMHFRNALDTCDKAISAHLGQSILSDLFADREWSQLDDVALAQPAIFAVQVALAAAWSAWGINPDAIVGHSMGEVAAAHVAGALCLEDAAKVICERGQLLRRTRGSGAMLSVELSTAEAQQVIDSGNLDAVIAASNSRRSTVISGDREVLGRLLTDLERQDRFAKWVNVDVAAHGPQVWRLSNELGDRLGDLEPAPPEIPLYSSVTGDLVTDRRLDADYWVQNISLPVHFSAAIGQLLDFNDPTFIEVSPHPILLPFIGEDADDLGSKCNLLPSMRRDHGNRSVFLPSLGTLYTLGQQIAWGKVYEQRRQCVKAPTYPWQHERYWLGPNTDPLVNLTEGSLQSRSQVVRSSVQPHIVFAETTISTQTMPQLVDHVVQGEVLLPGAGIVTLVLETATTTLEPDSCQIRDLLFHHPIALEDERPRLLQTVLTEYPEAATSFVVNSQDSQEAGWFKVASGFIEPISGTEIATPCPVSEILSRCNQVVTASSFYDAMAQHGFQYGPSFQAITQIWRSEREALASLKPLIPEGSPYINHHLTPEVVDSCFQLLAATVQSLEDNPADTYMPVGIARLRIHRRLTSTLWCHAIRSEVTDRQPDSIYGDVLLLDNSGNIIMTANGLHIQRIGGKRLSNTPPDLYDGLYELEWQPIEQDFDNGHTSRQSKDSGTWLIFGENSATTDTLYRELAENFETCVLVNAGDTYAQEDADIYRIDPAKPEDYRRLIQNIAARELPPLRGVLHFWSSLASTRADGSVPPLRAAQLFGPISALHLIQALSVLDQHPPPRLWLVTQGAQVIDSGDSHVAVEQAPVWGLGRSVNHEYPELNCARVDLPARPQPADLLQLVNELLLDGPELDIALRGGLRYVARLRNYSNVTQTLPATLFDPAANDGDTAFLIECRSPGNLDSIRARCTNRRAPAPGEIEVRVHTAALNFVDVIRANGLYPGQTGDPLGLGIECSGTVAAVGAQVSDFCVGDPVIAFADDTVSSFVTTPACLVAHKPPNLTFEEAASISVAYLTAWYCLKTKGNLSKGERVLIHSAAGGVGVAAVRVAQQLGAIVYGTAGTAEKRNYLRELGVKHVCDSRSLEFVEDISAATNGEGVDVVLNSLSGEALTRSLTLLRPYGRFIEIGKSATYGHGRIPLWDLRENASYTVVDLAQTVRERPETIGALLREILADVSLAQPLPTQTFSVARTADAIRELGRGKHIGKVAVRLGGQVPVDILGGVTSVRVRADATYLITGGLGGIGCELAKWMAEQGARHLALMGRRPPTEEARHAIREIEQMGLETTVLVADCALPEQVAAGLDSIRASMPPLRGVIHAAGVLDDATLANLDQERLCRVMQPKYEGAWNLHSLTADLTLDFFVLFSSVASLFGSPGQAHYAAANSFLDALAWHRRTRGLPATSINWGPWGQIGMATNADQQRELKQRGIKIMEPADALQIFSVLLKSLTIQAGVLRFDWDQLTIDTASDIPMLADLRDGGPDHAPANGVSFAGHLNEMLQKADVRERRDLITFYLRSQIARRLALDAERLDVDLTISRLGIDSLTGMEIRNQIQRDLNIRIPVSQLLQARSVTNLADHLVERFSRTAAAMTPPLVAEPATSDPSDAVAVAAPENSSRWIRMLADLDTASDQHVDDMLRDVLAERERRSNA